MVAPEQDDVPECDYTIAESEPIFEEFESLAEKPNFRQRIMRMWTKQATESKGCKADNTKPKRHSVPNIHFHSPPPLPPALRETRRSFNHHMNGFKRWRSVLHRNSVSTEEPAIPDTKPAAPVKPLPRPRALSEDNGRLHLHMNDRLDYLQDPIKEGNTRKYASNEHARVSFVNWQNFDSSIAAFTITIQCEPTKGTIWCATAARDTGSTKENCPIRPVRMRSADVRRVTV